MIMIYVQRWQDDRFWLVGSFDGVKRASDWANDPLNNPEGEWRWQTTELDDPRVPVSITSPHKTMRDTANIYILDLRDARFALLGPFDTEDQAYDWTQDPANKLDDAWQMIKLTNPLAPVEVISPQQGGFYLTE
jgi:hypothetical protein